MCHQYLMDIREIHIKTNLILSRPIGVPSIETIKGASLSGDIMSMVGLRQSKDLDIL